jgi:hypothetical protein
MKKLFLTVSGIIRWYVYNTFGNPDNTNGINFCAYRIGWSTGGEHSKVDDQRQ